VGHSNALERNLAQSRRRSAPIKATNAGVGGRIGEDDGAASSNLEMSLMVTDRYNL
jgi:hypothetical protein